MNRDAMTGNLLRLDRWLVTFEWTVASSALTVGLFVSIYTITARALLFPTAEWVLELPMELLVIAAIYGSGALISSDRHLRIDFLVARLPQNIGRICIGIVRILLALFCAYLALLGVVATIQADRVGIRIPELFDLPSAIPMGIGTVGFTLWSLHNLLALLRPLTVVPAKEPSESP
jgi:TRAP-type C4-dicarboxylate transport system permease small subunit